MPQIRDFTPLRTATAETFTSTLVHTCWYVAGALLLVSLLSTRLPRRGAALSAPELALTNGDSTEIATTLA